MADRADRRRHRAGRAVATLLLPIVVLTGCGGAPGRADFVARSRETVGDDLYKAMADRGISRREADKLVDDFLTCQYDALKGNVELLQKVYDNPSDVSIQADIDTRASTCTTEMQAAMTGIADPAPPTTTTTTIAVAPTTVVPPVDDSSTDPSTGAAPTTTLAPPPSLESIPTTSGA